MMVINTSCVLPYWCKRAKEAQVIRILWSEATPPNIARLYKFGYLMGELAQGFSISVKAIRSILLKNGVTLQKGRLHYKISDKEWKEKKAEYNNRCAYCDKRSKRLQIDHIIPLTDGGKDEIANIVPACKKCNPSKGKRSLENWKSFKKLQLNLSQI